MRQNEEILLQKAYVNTAYGQIHTRQAGKPKDEPPLILLHQTPSSSTMFSQMLPLLARDFWVIAPDLPGFGASDVNSNQFNVGGWAQSILAMLDVLEISSYFLFGHHTGASVAVQMAFEQPDRVAKLVLSGPPLLTEGVKTKLWAALPKMEIDEEGAILLETWQRMRAKDPTATLALSLRETLLSLELNGRYSTAYQAVFDHDFATQLASLTCPILLMAGEEDSLRASLEPAYALAPHSVLKILPNAGTYICDKQPERISKILQSFFG